MTLVYIPLIKFTDLKNKLCNILNSLFDHGKSLKGVFIYQIYKQNL